MEVTRFSSIGRPVDPDWPTNRAIVWVTALVTLGYAVIELLLGHAVLASLIAGVLAGLAVFLAWALGRELDPDRDVAAFAGAALALAARALLGPPSLVAVVLVLLALRVVNRTVGPPARITDTLAILAIAAWVAWGAGDWLVLLALALAFFLDAALRSPYRLHVVAGGAALALAGVAFERGGGAGLFPGGSVLTLVAFALLLPFSRVMSASRSPSAVTDVGGRPLSAERVRAAQALGLLLVVAAIALEGRAGLARLSPLWAAAAGAGLYGIFAIRR